MLIGHLYSSVSSAFFVLTAWGSRASASTITARVDRIPVNSTLFPPRHLMNFGDFPIMIPCSNVNPRPQGIPETLGKHIPVSVPYFGGSKAIPLYSPNFKIKALQDQPSLS